MMKWSVTFDRTPSTATIGGVVYDVAFGYRTMMAAEIEMFRQDISDEQKMLNALNCSTFEISRRIWMLR